MAIQLQGDIAVSFLFVFFSILTIALPASNVGGAFELSIFEIIEALQIQLRFDNGSNPAASALAQTTLAVLQFMAACLVMSLLFGAGAGVLAYQNDSRGKLYLKPAPWLVAAGILTIFYPIYIIADGIPAVFITPLRIEFVGGAAYVGFIASAVGIFGGVLTWMFPPPEGRLASPSMSNP